MKGLGIGDDHATRPQTPALTRTGDFQHPARVLGQRIAE